MTAPRHKTTSVLHNSTAVLVGIAGSHNAFSLSLYNLKVYAYQNPVIRDNWDISVIQHPLIGLWQRSKLLSELTEKIVEKNPTLVGFSCYMWNIDAFLTIATNLKLQLPDVKVLFGGPEIATEYVKDGHFDTSAVDFCVSGEGELTFSELLVHLTNRKSDFSDINGLSHRTINSSSFLTNPKRNPFKSLTDIPSPFLGGCVDEDVLARKDVEANIETQRGCNLRCSYCIYHKDMDRITYSDVKRVTDEIRFVTQRGVEKIRFVDANFSSNKPYAKSLMKSLISEQFKTSLAFELIPGFIDDELASLFGKYSALYPENKITVGVGVQTINRDILKKMRRPIRKEKFEKTFELFQKYNIYTKIDLIIGLPGEDINSIERTLEYMVDQLRNSRAHFLCCHVMRGLPGTELLDIAKTYNMSFSSDRDPHELIESPILPRQEMIQCLRRTGVLFRLINHDGWANREFLYGENSGSTNIRDLFFSTKDKLGLSNIGLIDLIVDSLLEDLGPKNSWFAMDDFPHPETWWWSHSWREVRNEWLVNCFARL